MRFTFQVSCLLKKALLSSVIIAFLLPLLSSRAFAQASRLGEESVPAMITSVDFGFYLPAGDLKNRFGKNMSIGLSGMYKLRSNWLFGASGGFLFGGDVKEDSLAINLITGNGYIVGTDGLPAEIALFERGFIIMGKVGKLFPIKKTHQNAGIALILGAGFMQHKIHISDRNNALPQLQGDYLAGYDRLSNGPAVTQFVGYLHLDKNKRINFYAGLEATEAFTQTRRLFNFDTRSGNTGTRIDVMLGIKVGWILPFYGKKVGDYYTH